MLPSARTTRCHGRSRCVVARTRPTRLGAAPGPDARPAGCSRRLAPRDATAGRGASSRGRVRPVWAQRGRSRRRTEPALLECYGSSRRSTRCGRSISRAHLIHDCVVSNQAGLTGLLLPSREALLWADSDLAFVVEAARRAEQAGFDSVWAGDSLLARPRGEPLTLLAGVAGGTTRGTP